MLYHSGVSAAGQASVTVGDSVPPLAMHHSGASAAGHATVGIAGLGGTLALPKLELNAVRLRGAAGLAPDLSVNAPIDLALQLGGTLVVQLPQPQPDLYGQIQQRTMQTVTVTMPTPAIVNGRPTVPAYWAVSDSVGTPIVGAHHIHAIPDPDPVWNPATSGWFYPPPPSGVGDARWTVQTLPDPAGYPGSYYWLGTPSEFDGTRGIENGAQLWAPDASTPYAPAWMSIFPYKPSVRALDVYLPGGNVVHHPKGVHCNSAFIEHMWLDWGSDRAQPFTFVLAAMIASFPSPGFVHHLLDAGRNPDAVGFPRISDTDCGTPRDIADGLGYRTQLQASGASLSIASSNNPAKAVVSRFDANVRPKMFFGIFNGAQSQVGAYDPGARRVKSGAIDHTGAQHHRYLVFGRKQNRIAQGDSSHIMIFEIRYWRRALLPSELDDQYAQLSSTYQFNAYRGV